MIVDWEQAQRASREVSGHVRDAPREQYRPLIGLTGYARTGKDTIARELQEAHGYTVRAFADPLREMAGVINPWLKCGPMVYRRYSAILDHYGYERAKAEVPEFREFLQRLGTEAVRNVLGIDTWVQLAERRLSEVNDPVVFVDARFENEADMIRRNGGIVVQVVREGIGPANDHASEVDQPTADITVSNDDPARVPAIAGALVIASRRVLRLPPEEQ